MFGFGNFANLRIIDGIIIGTAKVDFKNASTKGKALTMSDNLISWWNHRRDRPQSIWKDSKMSQTFLPHVEFNKDHFWARCYVKYSLMIYLYFCENVFSLDLCADDTAIYDI